jgi:putative DNA primase/helicase
VRQEFKDFAGVADGFSTTSDDDVEPWPEPVDIAELLQGIETKLNKHVVIQPLQPHYRTAVVLWIPMTWVHDEIAIHSPILTATSADPGMGKTELLAAVARLVPKPSMNVESTGPNVYRYVDAHKPTLIIDEADDLFTRKSDLKHIINASWTRGTKIPRQVSINGIWTTVHFDPFCPKALGLLGRNLPHALKTRSIEIRMVPKREEEKVAFEHTDDFEFATLRRELMRFAADHAAALKTMQPTLPPGLNNRAAMNWKLQLAIAELAGGPWPERAREAAERLSRSGRQPSDGVKLLGAIRRMFAESDKKVLASKAIVSELVKDPTDIWVVYNRGGAVTQRQVAHLLSAYEITPDTVHPTRRPSDSPKGYKFEQFEDVFARYLPDDPHIRTSTIPKRAAPKRKRRRKK